MARYDERLTWITIGAGILALLALIWWGAVYDPHDPEDVQSEADEAE